MLAGGLSTCVGHAVRFPAAASLHRSAALHRGVRSTGLGADRSKSAVLYPVRTVTFLGGSSYSIPHVRPVVGRDPRRTVAGLDWGRYGTMCIQGCRCYLAPSWCIHIDQTKTTTTRLLLRTTFNFCLTGQFPPPYSRLGPVAIGVGDGVAVGHVPPPKLGKIYFRQLSRKIRAFCYFFIHIFSGKNAYVMHLWFAFDIWRYINLIWLIDLIDEICVGLYDAINFFERVVYLSLLWIQFL